MYPLNHTIKPATLKTHLQEHIPGAHVEIVGRHKGGSVWAENDFDYESEDEMHNRNQGKISNAVKKLLTK